MLYGGVYLLGFLLYVCLPSFSFSSAVRLNCAIFAANGAIIGGRLGYVLFYEPLYYMNHPFEILEIWRGGMSFHGGVIGLLLGLFICSRISSYSREFFFKSIDRACLIALFIIPLGRLCNYINGELWGRVTTLPWGIVFEGADSQPRHPVQLYEAFCEGPLLALVLYILYRASYLKNSFSITCFYFLCYSLLRFFTEFFREPDAMVGYFGFFTMGQILCLAGIVCSVFCLKKLLLDKKLNSKE